MVSKSSQEIDVSCVCFAVKPNGYEVYIKMGDACDGKAPIFIGKHIATNHFVAIRQIPLEDSSIEIESIHHEIKMHKIFDCPYILSYYATFLSGSTLWIVMPLSGYGSCLDIMQANFQYGLPELAISLILKEVLNALMYLHDCGVIHRSIRASHVLVSETGLVRLTGLRNCYVLEKHGLKENKCWHFPTNSKKSLNYYSPEILAQELLGYDQKSDIYSVGILACELANGHTPFSGLQAPEMLYEKLSGNMPLLLDRTTCAFMEESERHHYEDRQFSDSFHEFLQLCCQHHPNNRPSAAELLNHSFFKQARKVTLDKLPDILVPLTPLTDAVLKASEEMQSLANIVTDMSTLSFQHDDWLF